MAVALPSAVWRSLAIGHSMVGVQKHCPGKQESVGRAGRSQQHPDDAGFPSPSPGSAALLPNPSSLSLQKKLLLSGGRRLSRMVWKLRFLQGRRRNHLRRKKRNLRPRCRLHTPKKKKRKTCLTMMIQKLRLRNGERKCFDRIPQRSGGLGCPLRSIPLSGTGRKPDAVRRTVRRDCSSRRFSLSILRFCSESGLDSSEAVRSEEWFLLHSRSPHHHDHRNPSPSGKLDSVSCDSCERCCVGDSSSASSAHVSLPSSAGRVDGASQSEAGEVAGIPGPEHGAPRGISRLPANPEHPSPQDEPGQTRTEADVDGVVRNSQHSSPSKGCSTLHTESRDHVLLPCCSLSGAP